MVFHNADCLDAFEPFLSKGIWPKENCLPNLDCYRDSLRDAGFKEVRVEDITQFSAMPALDFLAGEATRHLRKTRSLKPMQDAMRGLSAKSPWNPQNCSWCLAYAVR